MIGDYFLLEAVFELRRAHALITQYALVLLLGENAVHLEGINRVEARSDHSVAGCKACFIGRLQEHFFADQLLQGVCLEDVLVQ